MELKNLILKMILKPWDPFAKHAYILNGLVLQSWLRINIPSKKWHKEQEKELRIQIMECKRLNVNDLGLIFCIPLICHREPGFYFLLRSLFTLYVFQAAWFQGRLCRDCLGEGGLLGIPLSPDAMPGRSSYLDFPFPHPKGKDLNLIYFLNWNGEVRVQWPLSIAGRSGKW